MLKNIDIGKQVQRLAFLCGFLTVVVFALSLGLTSVSKDFLELTQNIELIGWIMLAVTVVLFGYNYRQELKAFLTSRQARYGTNATIMTICFIAIIVVFNYLSSRHHYRFDVTAAKQFSLSDQTVKILKSLDKEIKVTAYFMENPRNTYDLQKRQQAKDAFSNYSYISDKLKVEFVDPEKNPVRATQAKIMTNGSMVFESGSKKKIITASEEQDITGAILGLLKQEESKIYFLEGHGEMGINSTDQQKGINKLKPMLERELYKVETLNLMTSETETSKLSLDKKGTKTTQAERDIPADCSALVIAGPDKPLPESERSAIIRYLDKGGKIFVMLTFKEQTGLESVLSRYGIVTANDVVVDPKQRMGGAGNPVITDFPFHDITKNFVNVGVIFPLTRSVSMDPKLPSGVTGTSILKTSPLSWGETALNGSEVKFDDGKDTRGPVSVGVAATLDVEQLNKPAGAPSPSPSPSNAPPKKQGKIVTLGTANFVNNTFISIGANLDLFMNSLNWLAGDEQLISIRPKTPEQKQLNLSNVDLTRIFWLTIVIFPLLILAIGGFVLWKRR